MGRSRPKAITNQSVRKGATQEKLEIAKNMLFKLHLEVEVISQATCLTQEEIGQLQQG